MAGVPLNIDHLEEWEALADDDDPRNAPLAKVFHTPPDREMGSIVHQDVTIKLLDCQFVIEGRYELIRSLYFFLAPFLQIDYVSPLFTSMTELGCNYAKKKPDSCPLIKVAKKQTTKIWVKMQTWANLEGVKTFFPPSFMH